jgi:hypothetical protein
MIDELVLERMFTETAEEVPVPEDGAERVIADLSASVSAAPRRPSAGAFGWIAAAAVVVVVLIAVGLSSGGGSGSSKSSSAVLATPGAAGYQPAAKSKSVNDQFGVDAPSNAPAASGTASLALHGAAVTQERPSAAPPSTSGGVSTSSGPVDGAKIVKTGTLDLQVPHATLPTSVNRVTGVAVGLGGYVSDSRSTFGSGDATAQITIRVPVNNFETAVTQVGRLPDVKVLGSSENGTDVTGQYNDLQGQLTAATSERDALLGVLANAQTVGDILAVRDRITNVETEMNQLQGQINLLGNQATLSSLAITLSEKPPHTAAATVASPPSGLSKAWRDARDGFSKSIEWLIARSGGALIVLLAGLLLLFGIRYLYPVVRRGLL